MPLYAFQCNNCQKEFEFGKFHSETEASCPECGSLELSRLVGNMSFKVKGYNAANGYSDEN